MMYSKYSCPIKTWRRFAKEVRSEGCNLLTRLDDFPNSVLVTGCQRSGTTAIARTITQSDGMVNYWFGRDDELDAALVLSGRVQHSSEGRHCFQTTYLNECYPEYFNHSNYYRVIWVLRNPFSVVHSFLHNWGRFAFNELFRDCGSNLLEGENRKRYDLYGRWGLTRLTRACLSFNGKVSQLFELRQRLGNNQLMVIEYDSLVKEKANVLPQVYSFIDLPYRGEYADSIHSRSVSKALQLSRKEQQVIERICMPIYKTALSLTSVAEQ